jgi:hypothetical protein
MFRTKSTKRHFEQKNDAQKLFSNKKAQKRHFRQKSILRNVVRANGHRQNLQPRNVLFFTNSAIDKLLNLFYFFAVFQFYRRADHVSQVVRRV